MDLPKGICDCRMSAVSESKQLTDHTISVEECMFNNIEITNRFWKNSGDIVNQICNVKLIYCI